MPAKQKNSGTKTSRARRPEKKLATGAKRWKVAICQRKPLKTPALSLLRSKCQQILKELDLSKLPPETRELSILLTDDKEIQELNLAWRGKDKPTDVLSFPSLEGRGRNDPPPVSLGDIVISLETARRQAPRYSASFSAEILRLMIHGILHLLGYDHVKVPPARARQMRRLENKLLSSLD